MAVGLELGRGCQVYFLHNCIETIERMAGNLLGTQQSGNVVAIGFDLYCQVLKQAVGTIQGRPKTHRLDVHLDIDFVVLTEAARKMHPKKLAALIPSDYIEEPEQRINAYKQVAEIIAFFDNSLLPVPF